MRTLLIIIGFIFAMTFTSCATRVAVKSPNIKVVKVAPKHHTIVMLKENQKRICYCESIIEIGLTISSYKSNVQDFETYHLYKY